MTSGQSNGTLSSNVSWVLNITGNYLHLKLMVTLVLVLIKEQVMVMKILQSHHL